MKGRYVRCLKQIPRGDKYLQSTSRSVEGREDVPTCRRDDDIKVDFEQRSYEAADNKSRTSPL